MKQKLEQAYTGLEDALIRDLRSLVEVRSVSAYGEGLDECASLLKEMLGARGFSVEVLRNREGRPVVLAEKRPESSDGRFLLLYNHYDVQPPEPLEEWRSEPFKLVERDGRLYGRGVSDDKGDIVSRLYALELLNEIGEEHGVGVRWLIEGEEEIGSPNLESFIDENIDRIRADACLWEAGDMTETGIPNFYLGVKGMLYVEITVRTAEGDRHSMYAPIMPNAAWELVGLLKKLRDGRGRVKIPNFYKDVRKPSREELQSIRRIRMDYGRFLEELGVKSTRYKTPYAALKALVFEPTCNIAGLSSGHVGAGAKTITPASASVKIDMRLVPDQRPEEILENLRSYLERLGSFDVRVYTSLPPARCRIDSPVVKAAVESAEEVYGTRPNVFPSMYGTGPLFSVVKHGIEAGMLNSIAHPGSNLHAPNENILKEHLRLSTIHLAMLMLRLSRGGPSPAS